MNRHGVLHEVLLPKSWWIKLIAQPGCHANKSTELSRSLVEAISSLLFQLVGRNKAGSSDVHPVTFELVQLKLCPV